MNEIVIQPKPDYLDYPVLTERFLSEADIRPQSILTYRAALKKFIEYIGTNSAPAREHILEYKRFMEARGLKNTSIAIYLAAVRQFFEWAESALIYPNVARSIKLPKISREFKKWDLSPEQSKQLLDSIPLTVAINIRDFAMINLMLRTGVRDVEIHRANVEDIEALPAANVLKLQRKGRDAKDKFVVLEPIVLNPILEYLTYRKDDRAQGSPLFTGLDKPHIGQRLKPGTISLIVKTRLVAAGLDSKYWTAHSLRHTAATISVEAGVALQQVQLMMGHEDINTTMKYVHTKRRFTDSAEGALAKAF